MSELVARLRASSITTAKRARASGRLAGTVIRAPRRSATRVWSEVRRPSSEAPLPQRLRTQARRVLRPAPAPTTPPARPARQLRPDEQARALREAGEVEAAIELLEAALETTPLDSRVLRELQQCHITAGSLTGALSVARFIAANSPTPAHQTIEAQLAGRLRELEPTWYPALGVPTATDRRSATVLHLLKESLPYHERGYTLRTRAALRAQRRAGLDPVVVTSLGFPRLDGHEEFPDVDAVDGIAHHRLDLGPDFPYRAIPFDRALEWNARLAAPIVEATRPAVLHANSGYRGFDTAVVAIALGRRYGIPVVYDVRSFLEATWTGDLARSETGEHYELRRARELACMNDADLVFTIADSMRDDIVSRGIDPDRVVVIPNAVDTDEFRPRHRDDELARSLGLEGRIVLGYISNLGRREGLDVLLDAIALLRHHHPDVGGLIVGDGPELDGLRAQCDRLGLTDVVQITGPVPHRDIQRYYSLIDVFVVPRRDDHAARLVTPLKPFEAMAMARPLIVADLPALRELTDPPNRGLTFTPDDPAALATAAAELVADPARRHALGAAGRGWVVRERTWAANGTRYVEAYGRLGVQPEAR